jgi:peptide/histidine transporter 3/4
MMVYLFDQNHDMVAGDGSVDVKGRPVMKNSTGKWKACPFILGNCL